ncbi:hypothetical protein E1295_20645 [Nonomuraea mesophila]|uniref:Uncharacterized protein n=1 Tax=Nonomuraea mesophila TaxID=2530382 RepID=A0A4R5FEU2_9ACTN|nr:hypothetical protein [Nonomuraea mesophila]TDE49030.1 hypothetical protein E1295_20645 [Nonomuraea mesophila]
MDTMTCVQCGHPHPTRLTRFARPARYSCRACGAFYRPRTVSAPGRPDGPAPEEDPLTAFMPAHMVRWVRRHDPATDTPDRATLARWYKEFDALVARAASSPQARAVIEQAGATALDRLPAFNKVCAALHATCYDSRLATARLAGDDSPSVIERVAHLRHWLATAGRSTTWLEAPPAPPPDRRAVEELLDPPTSFTQEQVGVYFRALFGVDRGPSLPGVRARFGDDRIRRALLDYLDDGSRPLREVVARELDDGAP